MTRCSLGEITVLTSTVGRAMLNLLYRLVVFCS